MGPFLTIYSLHYLNLTTLYIVPTQGLNIKALALFLKGVFEKKTYNVVVLTLPNPNTFLLPFF